MAINLSALSQVTSGINAVSNLILATPKAQGYQPQQKPTTRGLPPVLSSDKALLFHYEGEQVLTLKSDITDHFIEDNTALQDQISLAPRTLTTHGFIGELNDVPPNALAQLKTIADKLTNISAYVPVISATAILAYNTAAQLYQAKLLAEQAAVTALGSLNGNGVSEIQNKQQYYFAQFYGYWKSRTLFSVQTPWIVINNMAIESLRAIQDDQTNVITDFEITFKEIQFATTTVVGSEAPLLDSSGRAATASGVPLDLSKVPLGPEQQVLG